MEEIQINSKEGRMTSPILSLSGKEKDTERSKNDSLTSVDIQEMERVRLSLQSMLKSSEHFLQDDKVSPKSVHTTPEKKRYTIHDADIFPRITTANLMSNFLSTDKKEVGNATDSTAFSEDDGQRSNKKYSKSLLLENTLLNETLEKERSKRKHCEQQIKGLQSKLLETQQELAAAVSADRKKDVMINQLDKTLARVVEDWKKHEEEKFDTITKLESQHENDAKFQHRQQDILAQFEKDLSLAAEALSQEQQRAANAERVKNNEVDALLQERDDILQLLEEEKDRNANLNRENESLEENAGAAKTLQKLFEQEKVSWQEEKSQLESQIELITKAHIDDLENERKLVDREKQVAEDGQRVLSAVQKEVQQLTVQLDTCFREKENLKTEITLLTAKFEAQRTRKDSEHRAELERQISKNLRDAQSQLSKSENEIKSVHKKQIEDLTKKYRRDLEEQLNNFHEQLKEKDRKLKETSEEYEERLTKSHNDLVTISTEREGLRNEKHKMIRRLQKMMQSHCAEAMSVLSATTENTVVNVGENERHDLTWMSRQTPALVTSAAHVGSLRESTHAYSSFVTPDNYGQVMQSPAISNRNQPPQPVKYAHGAYVPKSESGDSVHHWVRLPTMPADTAKRATYPNTSHIPNEAVVNEFRRTLQDNDGQRNEQSIHFPPQGSQDTEEQEISPTTTNESLIEQSPDELETAKPNLPMELSTDVLKMLQQQQSRQTELNHYVRQLLKKSPSGTSNGEFTATSDDGYDTKNADRSAVNEQTSPDNSQSDMLSSQSTYSDTGDLKQIAFTKSAATPGKRFSKIPAAQTPPSKDGPHGKSPGNSVLTPEQVGQLARLIQMYQKDNMENDIPSPQKLFQYLREVQIRGENEGIVPSKDTREERSEHSYLEDAMTTAERRKGTKAKRKLEVNIQPAKLKEFPIMADPDVTAHRGTVKKHFLDDTRRPGRTTITSDSELATVHKPDNKTSKSRKLHNSAVSKPLKRATGKTTKAWK